ncbi:arginase [Clostridium sp. AM58-1XD]|nr:arginase [Clostridium sp. AM58-1XD]
MTNRNHIRLCMRVRLPNKLKPNNYTESCMVNVADRWRERNVWFSYNKKTQKYSQTNHYESV